jgi:hypothetical protein
VSKKRISAWKNSFAVGEAAFAIPCAKAAAAAAPGSSRATRPGGEPCGAARGEGSQSQSQEKRADPFIGVKRSALKVLEGWQR